MDDLSNSTIEKEYTRADQCIEELEVEGAFVEILGEAAIRVILPKNVNLKEFWEGRLDLSDPEKKEEKISDPYSVFYNFGIVVVDNYPEKIPNEDGSITPHDLRNYSDREPQRFIPPQMPHFDNNGRSKFFILQFPLCFTGARPLKTGFVSYIPFAAWLSGNPNINRTEAIKTIAEFEVGAWENRYKKNNQTRFQRDSLYNWRVWPDLEPNVIEVSLLPGSFVCVNQWIKPCYMHGRKSSFDRVNDAQDALYRHFINTIKSNMNPQDVDAETLAFRLMLYTTEEAFIAIAEKDENPSAGEVSSVRQTLTRIFSKFK